LKLNNEIEQLKIKKKDIKEIDLILEENTNIKTKYTQLMMKYDELKNLLNTLESMQKENILLKEQITNQTKIFIESIHTEEPRYTIIGNLFNKKDFDETINKIIMENKNLLQKVEKLKKYKRDLEIKIKEISIANQDKIREFKEKINIMDFNIKENRKSFLNCFFFIYFLKKEKTDHIEIWWRNTKNVRNVIRKTKKQSFFLFQ